jgi:hypothetical protein
MEIGRGDLLFGSCSALGGSQHGVPRLNPNFKQSRPRRVCSKQNSRQEKTGKGARADPSQTTAVDLGLQV